MTAHAIEHHQEKCDETLEKVSKKNVAPGVEMILNDQLYEGALTTKLGLSKQPAVTISAYKDLFGPLGTTLKLPPGTRINALSKVRRKEGATFVEVEIPAANFKGIMYWVDLYRNARLVKISADSKLNSKAIFEGFSSFYESLPQHLKQQIDSFGIGTGFKDLKPGNPPVDQFFLMLSGSRADFIIDESISTATIKDNKIYLPKKFGAYEVSLLEGDE